MANFRKTIYLPYLNGGHCTHFYHFLIEYLLPAVNFARANPDCNLVFQDCGPLSRWFVDHLEREQFQIVSKRLIAARVVVGLLLPPFVKIDRHMVQSGLALPEVRLAFNILFRSRRWRLRRDLRQATATIIARNQRGFARLDSYTGTSAHSRANLAAATNSLKAKLSISQVAKVSGRPQIVVVNRAEVPNYYVKNEGGDYGPVRRSIPNLANIVEVLSSLGDVTLLSPDNTSTEGTIKILHNTDLLIGQHGAGLSNMVWMQKGSHVLEITYPEKTDPFFSDLAELVDLDFVRIVCQSNPHDEVDPIMVKQAALSILETPEGPDNTRLNSNGVITPGSTISG